MTNRSYNPTNYRFTDHTKKLVGTKTKSGHLEGKRKGELSTEKGILLRVVRSKIYADGWEVQVGKDKDAKVFKCYYGDNIVYLPDSKKTDLYFIPKKKCEVILSLDTKTSIYTIKKINDPEKQPITFFESQLILENDGTQITIEKDSTQISSDTHVDGDVVSTGDVVVKTEKGKEDISLKDIYKQVQEMKITVDEMSSDSND